MLAPTSLKFLVHKSDLTPTLKSMPKTVRLKGQQHADWRLNAAYLVTSDGLVERALEEAEEKAIFPVVQHAKKTRGTLAQSVEVLLADGTKRTLAVTVIGKQTGLQADAMVFLIYVDGKRRIPAREIICAQMLAQHGECRLVGPNGKFMKLVRDTRIQRPTFEESQKSAPSPHHCACKDWGDPHPQRHHAACPWNSKAPPHERAAAAPTEADLSGMKVVGLQHPGLSGEASVTGLTVTKTAVPPIASPEGPKSPHECPNDCRGYVSKTGGWAMPKGRPPADNQHHPMCQYADAWLIKTNQEKPMWVMNMSTGERIRRATIDEVGESHIAMKRTGAPTITLSGELYAIVEEAKNEDERKRGSSASPAHAAAESVPTLVNSSVTLHDPA